MCNLSRSTTRMSLSGIARERGGGRVFSSVLQIEAHGSHGSQWSHSSRAFSLFFFCKMKGRKQGEGFLALHFLSLLKHAQGTGLRVRIKRVVMPQPPALLLL